MWFGGCGVVVRERRLVMVLIDTSNNNYKSVYLGSRSRRQQLIKYYENFLYPLLYLHPMAVESLSIMHSLEDLVAVLCYYLFGGKFLRDFGQRDLGRCHAR
jgi:hypothetical protein